MCCVPEHTWRRINTVFALAEGKDGGTFYTPATVVRYMVEVLDPQPGDKKFLDTKWSVTIQQCERQTPLKVA